MKDVLYRRSDGTLVKSLAFYSYRNGLFGEWMVGDVSLADLNVVSPPEAEIALCADCGKPFGAVSWRSMHVEAGGRPHHADCWRTGYRGTLRRLQIEAAAAWEAGL